MSQHNPAEISLRIPGAREYALILRTALGGVAILKDLDVDAMDDLRAAADEACDCLLHQGREVRMVELSVRDTGESLTVSLEAEFCSEKTDSCLDSTDVSRAVLETLIPEVELVQLPCGSIKRIDLTLPKAV